jgi:hypothetical protein
MPLSGFEPERDVQQALAARLVEVITTGGVKSATDDDMNSILRRGRSYKRSI